MPLVWPWPELPEFLPVGAFGAISVVGVAIVLHQLLSPSVDAALIWQIMFLAVSGAVFLGVLKLVPGAPAGVGAIVLAKRVGGRG